MSEEDKLKAISPRKEKAKTPQSDDYAVREFESFEKTNVHLNKQNLGVLGWLFGSKEHAKTNISGLASLTASIVVFASLCVALRISEKEISHDARENAMRLGILALGYLFGKTSK